MLFAYSTYLSLNKPVNIGVLWFVFFSTMLAYNFQRVYRVSQLVENTQRNQWLVRHKLVLYILVFIGFLGTVISLGFLPRKMWYWLVVPAFVSVFYVVPLNRKKESLRDLPRMKIFFIAITWVLVAVALPLVSSFEPWQNKVVILLEKFLFVVALTIPFDMRDMKIDSPRSKTIPQVIGLKKSIYLTLFLLLISIALAYGLYQHGVYEISTFVALAGSYLLSMFVVLRTNPKRPELFYTGIIDGLFVVQFLLILLGDILLS